MAKKRASDPKRGKRKSSGTSLKKTLEAAITSNPFLNFFLSKCRVKGNAKLHKFAKKAGDQWKDMSYQEKTPYYLLADKARAAPVRKKSRKRRYSESDIGEGSFSMITVVKKPPDIVDEDDNKANCNTDKEEQPAKKKAKQEDEQEAGEGSKRAETPSEIKIEDATKKQIHHIKPYKKRKPSNSSTISTSFHSIESDDSVERASKRRGNNKCKSWTDSFDYMS